MCVSISAVSNPCIALTGVSFAATLALIALMPKHGHTPCSGRNAEAWSAPSKKIRTLPVRSWLLVA